MTDSAPSDESVTHGILNMGINLNEIHSVALLKLQKLNTLKDKHEHLDEEAENLTTILQDFMMMQMNIEAEENKLSCQIHEMEEELARMRDNLEVKVKEAARLREQLITLRNKEEEDLQNYEAKMKAIFMKYQQAHENYVRQNQEDTMTAVENEKEAVQCEINKLKEQLVLVQAKFHDTFSKPQPQHADFVALCTVLKQMEADTNKCTGENAELRNRLKELEEEYKKLTLQLHTLKATP